MRWDLVDRFVELRRGQRAVAEKTFSGTEDFFAEHYPGRPVVPETLLIEMVAQAGGVLYGLELDFKKEVILAKIGTARFLRPAAPPAALTIEARLSAVREEGSWIEGEVRGSGGRVAEVSLFLVAMESLGAESLKNIVFNDAFLKHYDIRRIAGLSEALR